MVMMGATEDDMVKEKCERWVIWVSVVGMRLV